MALEKDTLHVLIRLPFKRPPGFIEPPPIVWTDDMEHRLWQYMSQKNTDWNYIAEQLGVPTSNLVRHAAFIYETQLRGIQQQLRLSEVGKTSSTSSPASRRSGLHSRPPSLRSAIRPSSSSSTPRSTWESQKFAAEEHMSPTSKKAGDGRDSPRLTTPRRDTEDRNVVIGRQDSMLQSTISTIAPRPVDNNSPEKLPQALSIHGRQTLDHSVSASYRSFSSQEQSFYSPVQSWSNNKQSSRLPDGASNNNSEHEEDAIINSQFAKLQLDLEEPAFLPTRRLQGSSVQSPSTRVFPTEPLAEQQRVLGSALLSKGAQHPRVPTAHLARASETAGRMPEVLGKDPESTHNSEGSSVGHLSDSLGSSITQSALEDAFLSNFNNGSKMSSMAFSRRSLFQ